MGTFFFSLLSRPTILCKYTVWMQACKRKSFYTVFCNAGICTTPLGLGTGLIADERMTASSVYVERLWRGVWDAHLARLDNWARVNAWSPAKNNRLQWLQVSINNHIHTQVHEGFINAIIRMTEFPECTICPLSTWEYTYTHITPFSLAFHTDFLHTSPDRRLIRKKQL